MIDSFAIMGHKSVLTVIEPIKDKKDNRKNVLFSKQKGTAITNEHEKQANEKKNDSGRKSSD